ncbi:MAG TPA: hypothetical protein VFA65_00450 [Bryobacteraceae bacterium]|nr:hypothetical protein [Bryobacteraceae bacterium]
MENRKLEHVLGVETITDCYGLHEFRPEWSAFVSRNPPETPFQTPEWLITWWKHFGSGDLRVMVFRQESRLVGVMPLFLHEWNGRCQLTLIGAGLTDYLDPLFQPEYTPEIVNRLARELNSWADWDICDWQDLSGKLRWHPLARPLKKQTALKSFCAKPRRYSLAADGSAYLSSGLDQVSRRSCSPPAT